MKARTKFLKMFNKLPDKAMSELIMNAFGKNPMSLASICFEVRNNTSLGRLCLLNLGYIDE